MGPPNKLKVILCKRLIPEFIKSATHTLLFIYLLSLCEIRHIYSICGAVCILINRPLKNKHSIFSCFRTTRLTHNFMMCKITQTKKIIIVQLN